MPVKPLSRRLMVRSGCALGAAAAITLLTGGVAFAHVTAQPGTAVKGGRATVSFNVPTESDTAGTVKFEVTLPVDHPIAEVRTTPMAGWTERVTKTPVNPPIQSEGEQVNEVVHTITWTAQPGTRIGPGQFANFLVSMGPLPQDVDQLVMPAVQTYDDGTSVRWDQPQTPGGQEPEHPAPVVTLVAGSGTGGHSGEGPVTATSGTSSSDSIARYLAGGGLLLGALGLVLGLRRRAGNGQTDGYLTPEPRQSSERARHHTRL